MKKICKTLFLIVLVFTFFRCNNIDKLHEFETRWNSNDNTWFKEKILSAESMNFIESQDFCIRMSNVTGVFYSDFSENIYNESSYWTNQKKHNFIKNNYIFWNSYSKSCLFMNNEITINLSDLYSDTSIYNSKDIQKINKSFALNCE